MTVKRRTAFTLIELLVVVVIATVLLAISIPLLRSTIKENRVREASRILNTFIVSAKARALEKRLAAGIWIERSDPGSNSATQIFLAESPPPYGGDTTTAWARLVDLLPTVPGPDGIVDTIEFDLATGSLLASGVGIGDIVRLNFHGPDLVLTSVPVANNNPAVYRATFAMAVPSGSPPITAISTAWGGKQMPYQIYRKPQKASVAPLEMPTGIVLDLSNSGLGVDVTGVNPIIFAAASATDNTPVIVLFGPSGGIERIVAHNAEVNASATVFFLLGRLDGIEAAPDVPPDAPNGIWYDDSGTNNSLTPFNYNVNIASPSAQWVSVGHNTGAITTAENGWQLMLDPTQTKPTFLRSLQRAREFARSGQSMGGI